MGTYGAYRINELELQLRDLESELVMERAQRDANAAVAMAKTQELFDAQVALAKERARADAAEMDAVSVNGALDVAVKKLGTEAQARRDYRALLEAAQQQRDAAREDAARLAEALRWYVENDDVNDTPDNAFWLEGKARALSALAKHAPP